jgi:quinol monooxygenase YgiN
MVNIGGEIGRFLRNWAEIGHRSQRMIHVIATIRTVSGRRGDFLAAFRELAPLVRAEAGCIEYGPVIDVETPIERQLPVRDDVVTVLEKWASVKALEDHLAAPHMMQFREKAKDLLAELELRVMEPA